MYLMCCWLIILAIFMQGYVSSIKKCYWDFAPQFKLYTLYLLSINYSILGEVKKNTCLASPPASFFEAACFFLLFLLLKKLLKNKKKYDLFPKLLFVCLLLFFSGGKDRMLYRKIAFYIFRLPHQLFHLLWKLSRMSGGHLEKIGRPVVLKNVSGGHFEEKKEEKNSASSFLSSTEAGR